MDWTLAGSVILSGLVIVFLLLIILIGAVIFTSKIVNGSTARIAVKPEVKETRPVEAAPIAVIQDGIEEETVAVISAAICSYMGGAAPGAAYAIKSITRATSGRPVWGFAGMQQNTRPF